MQPIRLFLVAASLSWIAFCPGACSTPRTTEKSLEPVNTIPKEFRTDGMVSSSTYQVFVRTYGETEDDAKINGIAAAREKAFKYISKEPFIRTRLSEFGSGQLKKLIEEYGRVIRTAKDSERTWSIVFQISKIGLREDFQKLR